jgi:hypothetical protein
MIDPAHDPQALPKIRINRNIKHWTNVERRRKTALKALFNAIA